MTYNDLSSTGLAVSNSGNIDRISGSTVTPCNVGGNTRQLLASDEFGGNSLAVGNGIALRSTDGVNFSKVLSFPSTVNAFDVQFVSPSVAYVACQWGKFLKTINGGASFAVSQLSVRLNGVPTTTMLTLHAISFVSELVGIGVSENGTFLRTSDGGVTWDFVRVGSSALRDCKLFSSGKGFACGFNGNVYVSNDFGATWTKKTTGITTNLHTISMVNESVGFCAGEYGAVISTSNGGDSWTPLDAKRLSVCWFGSCFKGASDGHIVGVSPSGNGMAAKWDGTSFTRI